MPEIVDMTTEEFYQMELGQFIDKNDFVRSELLSFLFGGRDYDLEYKYDRFYKNIDISKIVANFATCYKADDVCADVVDVSQMSLLLVPDSMKSKDMCETAIERYPHLIGSVPRSIITYEMAENATKHNPEMITYVPDHLLDYKLCLQVVMNDGQYIFQIPEIYRDCNMFTFAVEEEPCVFRCVPEKFKTDDMIRRAMNNPSMFKYVPMEKRTRIMSLRAVKKRGEMLAHVPVEMRDTEMCMAAFTSNQCDAIKHFPYKIFTQELCDTVMSASILHIKICPSQFITDQNYTTALHRGVLRYFQIPDHMKTYVMSAYYMRNGGVFNLVPIRFHKKFYNNYNHNNVCLHCMINK